MPNYSDKIYNYILKLDPTYKNDVSLQLFKSKMANASYSKKIYDWIGTADPTFKGDVSFDAFNAKLGYPKKKVTTASTGGGGAKPSSSASLSKAVSAGVQKAVESVIKPDGTYRYPGREDALYKKTKNQWYIDLGKTGNYTKVSEKSRIAALEKYAKTYTPVKTKGLTTVKSNIPQGVTQKVNEEFTKAVVDVGKILTGEKKPKTEKYEEPETFKAPGKDNKEYQLVYSESGVPVWNESVIQYQGGKPLTWKNEKTGKTGYVYDYKQVTDPKRVATLNKMYNKTASSSNIEQTYVGYPGKDDVEYRVNIDKKTNEPYWEKRPKGYNDFFRITAKGSIDALNAQFNKDIKYDAARDKFSGVAEDVELIKKKEFDTNLLSVNTALVGNNEDVVIKKLKAKFPTFEFKRTYGSVQEMLGDYIEVRSPDRKNFIKVSLDNWTDATDSAEAKKIRDFIRLNASQDLAEASKSFDVAEKENDTRVGVNFKSRRAVPGDPEYDINRPPDQQPLVTRTNYVTKEEKAKTEEKERLARKNYARESYLNLRDVYYRQKKAIETKNNPYDDKEVENMIAYLPNDKETIKNASKFADDINKSFQSYNSKMKLLQIYADDANERIRAGKMSEEEFNEQYKPKMEQLQAEIQQMGVDLKEDTKYLGTINKATNESIASEYIVNEARGTFMGGLSKKFVKGVTGLARLGMMTKEEQESVIKFWTGAYTTEEYMNSKNRSDVTKAIFSLGESLGALATGAALGGGPAMYASFFAQSYNEMKDELDMIKDPSGAGPSETAKVLMAGTYGVVSSILEKFGLDLALQKTGLGRQLTHAVIRDAFMDIPENASKEFVQAAIINSTKKMLATIPSNVLVGASGEGLTGMSQAVSKIGIQEVYDLMENSDYFNNKTAREIYADVLYDGYLEAIGGGVMSTAATAGTITGNEFREKMNKEQLEVLMNAAKMENIDAALMTNLKASIISGKYTKEEAKNIYDNFREVQGRINSMPDEMSVEDKSVALDLMTEKANLEKAIANKDESLTAPQRKRIAEINVELIKIAENAVQKQTTSEVPVQPEAAVSGEVAQGVPQAEPQVATQEGGQAVGKEDEKIDTLIEDRISKYDLQPVDLFEDMTEADNNIIERASKGEAVDVNALNGTIDYIYAKYKEITQLKKDSQQRLEKSTTIKYLDDILSNLDNDLDFLMTYKQEVEQGNAPISLEQFNTTIKPATATTAVETQQEVEPTVAAQPSTKQTATETIDVYHGGALDEKTGDIYVTEDKNQATEYAKGNEGQVIKYSIDKNKVASENDIYEAISELGIEIDDQSKIFELIDPRFEETYIGDENKQKLFNILEEKGFESASFIDEDLSLRNKGGVKNIVVFNAEKLLPSSITVTENQADNLYDQGYRPVINGDVQSNYSKENIGDLFEQSERIEMALPAETATEVEVTPVQPTEATVTPVAEAQPVAEEVVAEEQVTPEEEVVAEEKPRTKEDIDADVAKLESLVTQGRGKKTNTVAERGTILKSVDKARRAISKILPNVKIITHESDDSYRKATGEEGRSQGSRGSYIPATETNPAAIHINLTNANYRTVAHEVFHAILLNRVSSDQQASDVTLRMIKAISNKIEADSDLKEYLDDFASNYKENIQNEEKLSEFIGVLSENYMNQPPKIKDIINRWLNKLAQLFGLTPVTSETEVMELLDTIARKVATGKKIRERNISNVIAKTESLGPKEQGDGGEVGTFIIPRQSKKIDIIKAPSVKDDNRGFIKELVEDIDLREFQGMNFITNMYDYTNAGTTDLGNGLVLNLFGGKGYVPYMMSLKNKNLGDVSNLAAFNTKAQAETFIRNAKNGNAELFAPHSGTKDQSWQFQQHMFAELVDLILNNKLLSNAELITLFNNTIKSNKKSIGAFNQFKEKYGRNIKNFNSFKLDPREIVNLLDIENNFSPDLRKALNNAISANKKFQEAIGVKNKNEFYNRIMDPMNNGVEGGEIMGIVKFDPTTFEIVKTKPGDIDHHPSFGWTLLAKIDGIYQPTNFYKSYDVTDTYTKYNKDETIVSRKTEEEKFAEKNVTSSAGAIPKVATVTNISQRKQKETTQNWTPTPVKNMSESPIAKNSDKVRNAAVRLIKGLIDVEQYRNIVNKYSPINKIGTLFAPASTEHMELALGKKSSKLMAPVVDENGEKLKKVGTRLDIPSYLHNNAWVVTVHDERIKNGPVVSYRNAVKLKNVEFSTDSRMALQIAAGYTGKSTFARMVGEMVDIPGTTAEEQGLNAQLMVEDIMNDPNWIQVGMNPFRHSFFWNRENGMPVVSADEVIQIGGLVYAKNAKEVSPDSEEFAVYAELDESGKKPKLKASEKPLLDKSGKQIRFQQPSANIDEIVATARANNIQDDAIEVYLRNNGFSDADIIQAMTQMKPAKNINVEEIYRRSQEALKRKFDANAITRAFRFTYKILFERQNAIKNLMRGIKNKDAKRAFDILVDKAGATGQASYRFKRADRKIYGGLSSKLMVSLNQMIYARRILDINKARREKGKPPYEGIDGYNIANAMVDLNRLRNTLDEKTYEDLNRRAALYFAEFSESLRYLYESGRINEATYLTFKDREYSPIKTIKYILGENTNPDNADRQAATLGVTRKDINKLSDKNDNPVLMDSRWLLMMNMHTVAARAFENKMLNAWANAMENSTQKEKDALSQYIKENPIVRTTKDGRPVQKYELSDFGKKAELVGFTPITYFVDGQQRVLVVDDMYANQILDIKNSKLINSARIAGILTGVPVLRFMATVGNAVFILTNVPIDIMNATFSTTVYSWFKPLALVQATTGFSRKFIRSIYDDIRYLMNEDYENSEQREFIEHGGAMDFLSQDGIVGIKQRLSQSAIRSFLTKPFVAIGATTSYLGAKSEFGMRVAVYSKQKRNLIAKYKKKNNGQAPTGQDLDDIMWAAAREARQLIDFSQGGSAVKVIDPIFPYLNAATQGLRKPFQFMKENPGAFALNMTQIAIGAGVMAYHSMVMALAALPGDDDEEKLRKLKDTLDSIPQHTKAMFHIHFTGEKDKDGNFKYIKVKKLPFISILTTIMEEYAYQAFFKEHGGTYEVNTALMWETVKKSMPIWPTEIAGKNPGVAAFMALSYNLDTFTGKEIFKQPRDKKIKEQYQGKYDDKVEEFFKVITDKLAVLPFGGVSLSPKKLKVALEKIITSPSTNPMVHVGYAAMNGLFGKDQPFYEDLKVCGEMIAKSVSEKMVKYTDPDILNFVREDRMKAMETDIESEIWRKEQEVYNKIDKVYDSGKELTYEQLDKIILDNFDEMDFEKYFKKYDTYIRNRNTNKGILDILYERVPQSQAYKLYMEFGPKMTEEEWNYLSELEYLSGQKISNRAYEIYMQKYNKK